MLQQKYDGDKICKDRFGVCLETQYATNGVNNEKFRNQLILNPNQIYNHKTVHEFSVQKVV